MTDNSLLLTAQEILQATDGCLISGTPEIMFCGITTDSRQIHKGNLFIALRGENFDGHDFVQMAMEQNVAGILIDDEKKNNWVKDDKAVAVIKVADTLRALGDIAHYFRKRFFLTVIGLTGSSGKTTTKEMIAAIVGRKKKVLKT
jgi:UDP-N-acetylmuramoyl-tripeptide--D-alanyl-D-alanine ligase